MRRAIYRDRSNRTAFPDIVLTVPNEMDKIPLPEHIAFENKQDVKKPHVFVYSHTELYRKDG